VVIVLILAVLIVSLVLGSVVAITRRTVTVPSARLNARWAATSRCRSAGVDAVKPPPADVARRIVAALAADRRLPGRSAAAGEVYATDPYQLERMLAG
jgi:hypothetical protein